MTLCVEARIILPINADDFFRGIKYTISRANYEETKAGRRPATIVYKDENKTITHFNIIKMVPSLFFLQIFIKAKKLILIEESNNKADKYESCLVYTSPAMTSFRSLVFIQCVDGDIGEIDNYFEKNTDYMELYSKENAPVMPPEKILHIDFANHKISHANYSKDEDLRLNNLFKSGAPLPENWLDDHKKSFKSNPQQVASSCVYFRIIVDINMPFAGKVKDLILNNGVIDTSIQNYRRMFTWQEHWQHMSMEEIDQFVKNNDDQLSAMSSSKSLSD